MNPGIVALDPLRCHFLTAGRKIHGPIHIAKDDPIPPQAIISLQPYSVNRALRVLQGFTV